MTCFKFLLAFKWRITVNKKLYICCSKMASLNLDYENIPSSHEQNTWNNYGLISLDEKETPNILGCSSLRVFDFGWVEYSAGQGMAGYWFFINLSYRISRISYYFVINYFIFRRVLPSGSSSPVKVNRHFEKTYQLHIQDRTISLQKYNSFQQVPSSAGMSLRKVGWLSSDFTML
jgi:hypothetical protein